MFVARLTTKHCVFWLSGKGHWLTDEARAWRFSTKQAAYQAAAKTKCIRRTWGDKVTTMQVDPQSP